RPVSAGERPDPYRSRSECCRRAVAPCWKTSATRNSAPREGDSIALRRTVRCRAAAQGAWRRRPRPRRGWVRNASFAAHDLMPDLGSMSQANPLRLFVTHAWETSDDYLRVFEYLESARNFFYRNFSTPEQRPSGDKEALREDLRRQISPV